MLSVLIPTYNYNVYPLVNEIHKQALRIELPFEILVFDDASTTVFETNNLLIDLEFVTYKKLAKNIGRTAIRKELAQSAQYDNLLFMDADTFPEKPDFIKKLSIEIQKNDFDVLFGGVIFQKNKPKKEQLLRWIYGANRESLPLDKRIENPYLSVISTSFLIDKTIFLKLNTSLQYKRYGLDILFSYLLKKQNFTIKHIANPVYHLGLETSELFLQKSKEAVETLIFLIKQQLITTNYSKLVIFHNKYGKYSLYFLAKISYILFHNLMEFQLKSSKPSLRLFDWYRYGYYCLKK